MLWPGASTESIASGTFSTYFEEDPRVNFDLRAVRGPAGSHFSVWGSGFGVNPRVWLATTDGLDDRDEFHQLIRSHSHYNWAFTAPGDYEIDLQGRTFLGPDAGPGTEAVSGVETFHFWVGPPLALRIFSRGPDVILA